MLLSLSHKFLFIHTPKTAGSSIHHALNPYAVAKNRTLFRRATSNLPVRENPAKVYLRSHDTAAWAKTKLGPELYASLLTFTVVRDPFDRAVSYYEFHRQRPRHKLHDLANKLDFPSYLRWQRGNTRGKLHLQRSFVVDSSDRLIVDRILRMENLAHDFKAVTQELGINVDLPHKNTTKKTLSNNYLTSESRALIREIYAEDFEMFGYKSSDHSHSIVPGGLDVTS